MIRLILNFRKLNLLSAMEYRISFIVQIIFMILNDAVFFSIRYFAFQKFGTIGGTNFVGFIPLLIIMVISFSFVHIFFYGYGKISNLIMDGGLDTYFLFPKNMLLTILTSGFSVSAIGDLLYGFLLMYFVPNMSIGLFLWIMVLSFLGAVVFLGFMLIFQALTFYIGSSRELFNAVREFIIGPSHYPPKIFEGTILKYIFMSIIPVYYAAFLPYELLFEFSWIKFLVLILSAVFFFGLGYWIFFRGLKRYESGNAINVNL